MLKKALTLVLLFIISPTRPQSTSTYLSPCPNVFQYEPPGTEPGKWYGVVNLSTDSILHSLWLNVVLDSKADILGIIDPTITRNPMNQELPRNVLSRWWSKQESLLKILLHLHPQNWIGDVTTTDNIDFKIENAQQKIQPGPATAVRFFVQYNLLNKAPRLQAIRLNGREICNADIRLPTSVFDIDGVQVRDDTVVTTRPRPDSAGSRPQSSRPQETRPQTQDRPSIKPEDRPVTRPVQGTRPSNVDSPGPVYEPTQNPPVNQVNVNPYSINNGQTSAQNVGTQTRPRPEVYRPVTTSQPRTTTTLRYEEDDFDDNNRPSDVGDYFEGVPVTIVSGPNRPANNNYFNTNNNREQQEVCGKVVRNANPNPLVVNGKPTLEGQWPWQIALYHSQTVDNKYICGGTLVSHRHIITAAHCVTKKGSSRVVNKNTLTVYLGKHNLRTSVEGVQIRFVKNITVYYNYNASSFANDLAILELREDTQFTDWVRPACLWPDSQSDLSNVVGKKGSVVGWGFDDKGMATEELNLVEMPVIDQETCIRSYSDFFVRFTSNYTFCAGYRDGTSVCNGDSGGGMVFQLQGSWYLRGLVSLSVTRQNESRCDPTHYVVFTDLAKFSSWIKENIGAV